MDMKDGLTIPQSFDSFELDMEQIGNTSISENAIQLPYMGVLPVCYTDGIIQVTITADLKANLTFTVIHDGERYSGPIQATADEIRQLLFRFLFAEDGSTRHKTRMEGTGLTQFNLGFWSASFINWEQKELKAKTFLHTIN